MKTGTLFITPYGDELKIIRSTRAKDTIDFISKHIPKGYNDEWKKTVEGNYFQKDQACFVSCEDLHFVCFQMTPKNTIDYSVVLHECLHITNKILHRRGLYLVPETEEAYCYLQQFIFKEVCRFLGAK